MLNRLLTSIFGSRNDRLLKQLAASSRRSTRWNRRCRRCPTPRSRRRPRVQGAHRQGRVAGQAAAGSLRGLPRSLGARARHAPLRCAADRRHGAALGKIAEMRTGEGKTLVATLPVYLNALEGKGVHVVTVNDYLAKRDAAWMGKLYNWLGLSVGVVYPGMPHGDKKAPPTARRHHLRHQQRIRLRLPARQHGAVEGRPLPARPQLRDRRRSRLDPDRRGAHAADHLRSGRRIARTVRQGQPHRAAAEVRQERKTAPAISGSTRRPSRCICPKPGRSTPKACCAVPASSPRTRACTPPHNIHVVHHLNAAMRAHALYQRDVDYIVRDGEVVIVDEFTGRTLPGRRWSDGLHQAVEAKEGVPVQRENQTLASASPSRTCSACTTSCPA
jgi:preprotein translocase subunit SecA